MGTLFGQTFVRAGASDLRRWASQHHLMIVGASPDGALNYDQVRYSRPTLLVLGEERGGLTAEERALCHALVRIPMVAGTDSLNLGVAGSLLMYAVARNTQT
jgi:TrmH family RNA methyltransferase